jgi:hypothetical protein
VAQVLEPKVGPIRGDLLHWARSQQGLTMRSVRERGGPCQAYQSDVERRRKAEVLSKTLKPWLAILDVTEPFARGQIPRYRENPVACRGLAGEVGDAIVRGDPSFPPWTSLGPMERTREVLRLMTRLSRKTTRVVLAYVLDLEVQTLDDMLSGSVPVVHHLMQALADLTTLPESFFKSGVLDEVEAVHLPDPYIRAAESAALAGISADDLTELIGLHQYLPALRRVRETGLSPAALTRLINRCQA